MVGFLPVHFWAVIHEQYHEQNEAVYLEKAVMKKLTEEAFRNVPAPLDSRAGTSAPRISPPAVAGPLCSPGAGRCPSRRGIPVPNSDD
jgi:hypothetical protein